MESKSTTNRRAFLKNTALTSLSVGIVPSLAAAKSISKAKEADLLDCDKTTLDYYGEGPFYTENPPTIQNNQLAAENEAGTRMIISGRVFNLDCNQAIPNTIIDVWQANDAGQYDNNSYNLRGLTTSNEQGFYMFETIMPGKYLNGGAFRPAHIHFKITPPGFPSLTTQLYFEGDADLATDDASSVSSGQYDATHRIIPVSLNADGKLEGTWDIVINGEGISTATQDIHLNKGIIYKITPNPFTDRVVIQYGVFRKAKISLMVYNMEGNLVATLEEKTLMPEKYEAIWEAPDELPNGSYFVALKINDLQVHYLKLMRQQ